METPLQTTIAPGKTERFGLALTAEDREVLQRLADHERLSQAAVIRRLIWTAAESAGVNVAQDGAE